MGSRSPGCAVTKQAARGSREHADWRKCLLALY